MARNTHQISSKLALIATLFAMIVIILGAFTRLVDAGLGCPDWPGCYGHLTWPDEHHEIVAANEAFPHAPVNVEKTWPEMVHRYLASTLGLFAIAVALLAVRYRAPDKPLILPLFILGFIILQGMFGMWTVTLRLWPQVVTAHLLGGFVTLNLFWLLTLRLHRWQIVQKSLLTFAQRKHLMTWLAVSLLAIIGQIILGGWTTSNYAAVACPDLPTCQSHWLPPMDFASGFNIFQHVGPNYLGGLLDNAARVAIHMSHRIGAMVVLVLMALTAVKLFKAGLSRLALLVAVATAGQIGLGLSNILFHFPVTIAVAHNLGGVLLAASVVFALYGLYTAEPSPHAE